MLPLPRGLGIYPLSLIFLGAALILFCRRFGWKGFGLFFAASGAFDVANLAHSGTLFLLSLYWPTVHFLTMSFGWAAAKFPSFRWSNWWVALALAFFMQANVDDHVFFLALFATVYFTAQWKPKIAEGAK